jgi:enoyl-CoA hydratase
VPDAEIDTAVAETVARIVAGAPLVNRWHKKFAKRLETGKPLTEAEIAEGYAAFDTQDFQTGYKAFLAKAKPEFEGR